MYFAPASESTFQTLAYNTFMYYIVCCAYVYCNLNRNSLKIQRITSIFSTCIVFVSPSLQDIHQPFWDRWANVEAVPLDNMLNTSEIVRDMRHTIDML